MESIEFLVQAFYFFLKVCGGFAMVAFVSYLGVLIYDELTSRSNELYEYSLTLAVGIEYLLKGKPKAPHTEYHGRHRLDDAFISDLVVEMRVTPDSLCYDEDYAAKKALCGAF